MKICRSGCSVWFLLLVPLFTLAIDIIVNWNVEKDVRRVMLEEKLLEAKTNVDMIGTLIESNLTRDVEDNKTIVIELVNFIDRIDQVYCAAYKMGDDDAPILISDRWAETSIFEPFDYEYLEDLIYSENSGSAVIGYTPKNQTFRELYVYFRWVPAEGEPRYLVLAGVSENAIQTKLDYWESKGGAGRRIIILLAWSVWSAYIMMRIATQNINGNGRKIKAQNMLTIFN